MEGGRTGLCARCADEIATVIPIVQAQAQTEPTVPRSPFSRPGGLVFKFGGLFRNQAIGGGGLVYISSIGISCQAPGGLENGLSGRTIFMHSASDARARGL